jgi:flagellar motor switch protein FliN/FliY
MSEETDNQENGAVDDWAEAMAEQAVAEATREESEEASAAEFDSLEDTSGGPAGEEANLDVILDIPVTISMEIGRTHISIRNLLQLNQGSVVELDRLAGEPMDVLVNGTLVAHGEVVVVNEKFGIRLTDVISPAERVKKLK